MSPALRVWLYRARAGVWLAIGVWSLTTGHAESVALVWAASVYANIASDLAGAAAVDDRQVLARLDHIEDLLTQRGDDR